MLAYLQTLLLTGARPGKVITLRWSDTYVQWWGITIRVKVDGGRVISLAPYAASLLDSWPKRNEWVCSSARVLSIYPANMARRSARQQAQVQTPTERVVVNARGTGRLVEPGYAHSYACSACGPHGLSLLGLRRSFGSMSSWKFQLMWSHK